MPLPRFEKMPEDKKELIFEAAAKEVAAYGYENASLNRILEAAGISKGAAYYYFEDKEDLIATVLRHYWFEFAGDPVAAFEGIGLEEFWEKLAELYIHPFDHIADQPWLLGFSRVVWGLPVEFRTSGPMADIWTEAFDWMKVFIDYGQKLGAIRDDLPDELLMELIMAFDHVHDRWLADHWEEMDKSQFESFAHIFVDFMRKALEPLSCETEGDTEGGPAS
jgi:AcrR family transcriptional regulator